MTTSIASLTAGYYLNPYPGTVVDLQVFPDVAKKAWNDWELRLLVLLSLSLQTVLAPLGNRRKSVPTTRLRFAIWCAYLVADLVPPVALGLISRNALFTACPDSGASYDELACFWAPFLLVHLGGPDTITAYSLEDNELWLRHAAGLLLQTGLGLYIFLLSWPGCSRLPILSSLVYAAGLIKYAERVYALRSASMEHLRDSMLTPPDPGPNYQKFVEDLALKKAAGFRVEVKEHPQPPLANAQVFRFRRGSRGTDRVADAYEFFLVFRRLFVDLILTFEELDESQSYFRKLSPSDAFRVVEVELSFAYDTFYTKARVACTPVGLVLRVITSVCISLALAGFLRLRGGGRVHTVDLIITYLLLVVALLVDLYSSLVMLRSNWTVNRLSRRTKTGDVPIFPFLTRPIETRWSNLAAQYNLLSVCLEDKPAFCPRLQKLIRIDHLREKHRYKMYHSVSGSLRNLIFSQFLKVAGTSSDPKVLCTHRGSFALKANDCLSLQWSVRNVGFDQSILIWHVATDLCYYSEIESGGDGELSSDCKDSKVISDYMLYLLVMQPSMLPEGFGLIRFRDTCAEAKRFFREKGPMSGKIDACRKLLQVSSGEASPGRVKGDRSKSVLFDACRLATALRSTEQAWKVVSQVWVEILAYAATHCRGNQHAQQLRKGGELLTHVWLLMAHLGITEQFQVSQGHARAKLVVN